VRASKSVYRVWLTWFLCGRTELFHSDELVSTRAFHTLQVWRNWREGTSTNLIDETLRGSPVSDVMRCLHIGLLCVQENVSGRPTMAAVVPMLNSHSWSLPSPSRPAFLLDSNADTGLPLLESDTGTTTQDQSTENTQGTAYLSPNWNFHRLSKARKHDCIVWKLIQFRKTWCCTWFVEWYLMTIVMLTLLWLHYARHGCL
jgi:hypothetical protein